MKAIKQRFKPSQFLLGLILAAIDTIGVILTLAFSLLLNYHDILDKAQNELDIQIGTKRQIVEFRCLIIE